VSDKIEVWMDGGIPRGQDLLKALAMGAKGTMIERAFNFGLGAMGEAGGITALEIIPKEFDTSMALCGVRNVGEIGRHVILLRARRCPRRVSSCTAPSSRSAAISSK